MVTIAPVHDHTRHQECEYECECESNACNSSVLNSKLFSVVLSTQLRWTLFSNVSVVQTILNINVKFSQDKLKNSQLHRNRDLRDHFLRFRDIRDQVFKKGTLGDLRDQVASSPVNTKLLGVFFFKYSTNCNLFMFIYFIRSGWLEFVLLRGIKLQKQTTE